MDTADRIEITYEGNTADHLDLAQGIMAHKKSLQKGKRWKDLRFSAIVRRTFVRAGVFAVLTSLLALMMCFNLSRGMTVFSYHIVILVLEAGYTLFLLWCALTLRSQQQKLLKDDAQPHPGGRLVFDSYGIEDTSSDGRSMRLPWAEYELCMITPEVLVLALGNIMYFMPARAETVKQVTCALAHFRQAGSVIDLGGE